MKPVFVLDVKHTPDRAQRDHIVGWRAIREPVHGKRVERRGSGVLQGEPYDGVPAAEEQRNTVPPLAQI